MGIGLYTALVLVGTTKAGHSGHPHGLPQGAPGQAGDAKAAWGDFPPQRSPA